MATTYRLYSDGNYFPRARKSGFGGYIVNSYGEVVVEYSEQIKQTEYLHSFEILGIIRGLQIAKQRGIENIISHCDDKNTALKLKEIFEQNIKNVSVSMKPELYEKVIELSDSFKSIKFEYIPRNQNKYADSLSRRYAELMETNFLKHYERELDWSEKKLSQNIIPKRIFFAHKSLIRNPNKNNPFLVASHRNKKVRKISRQQEELNYSFLFLEYLKEQTGFKYKAFFYNNKKEKILLKEHSYNKEHCAFDFCEFLSSSLNKINENNIWLYSNNRSMNKYFEQKEKIPQEQAEGFKLVFQDLNRFDNVFYHHLPFEHNYSPEVIAQESIKKKLDNHINSVDDLIDQLAQGKKLNKCFGSLVRTHLRNYKMSLQRELEDSEKANIIKELSENLVDKGVKIPAKFSI